MCGWWIRELVDWSSGHLGKWKVPTSTYHVARLPGSPIAKSPNRRLDQLTSRRVDQSTPHVNAGNRNRLEGKSQIGHPFMAHRRRRGGHSEAANRCGNALDFHRAGEVRVSRHHVRALPQGRTRCGSAPSWDADKLFQPKRNCAANGAAEAQAPRPPAPGPAGPTPQPPHRTNLFRAIQHWRLRLPRGQR